MGRDENGRENPYTGCTLQICNEDGIPDMVQVCHIHEASIGLFQSIADCLCTLTCSVASSNGQHISLHLATVKKTIKMIW